MELGGKRAPQIFTLSKLNKPLTSLFQIAVHGLISMPFSISELYIEDVYLLSLIVFREKKTTLDAHYEPLSFL